VITTDGNILRDSFGVSPFVFRHDLAGHPLFELPRLAAAARAWLAKGRTDRVYLDKTLKDVSTSVYKNESAGKDVEQLETIAENNLWARIVDIGAVDEAYDTLICELLAEVGRLCNRPILERCRWREMTVFVTSPGGVTPFHMDHMQNLLLQISGQKAIVVFDPSDRSLISHEARERFYGLADQDAAVYRPDIPGKEFRVAPGLGVHIPSLAPHLVKNGAEVSVSASIAFCMSDIDVRARIYQANRYLRQFGLKPNAPGQSILSDLPKRAAMGMISKSEPRSFQEAVFSGVDRIGKIKTAFARGKS
jgi:Cupin-like domain